jgi:zinc/manganese transport system permease protein
MAVGLMMVPAAAARFWAREVWSLALTSSAIGLLSGLIGLLVSYHAALASGPAIILTASAIYAASVLAGPRGGIFTSGLRLRAA